MNLHRIKAIILHSWYHSSHSMETWMDLVWFTLFETIVFGFMASYFAVSNATLATNLMLGLLLWEIVRVGQYCITVSIMWEVWSKSFSSLFISPLTLKELVVGQMLSGLVKSFLVAVMISLISQLAFNFSIIVLGPMVIIYSLILLLFAYALGIFITGLILRFGTDIQSLAWGLIFFIQPFSAVFYPIEILPLQIRWLAYASPITFVMESARQQLAGQSANLQYVAIAGLLSLAYFILSSWFLNSMYQRSRKVGSFARLGN